MKKILAILMCAVLLLGLLVGCGTKEHSSEGTLPVAAPSAAGMLVLNVNGSVNITYDADGLVLNVEGIDANGSALAGEYTDYLGKSCSNVVRDLIANSRLTGILLNDYHCVMIKQAMGSTLPGATFLETIQKNAEAAVTEAELDATVILLTEKNLDQNGYIDLESAKALTVAALGLDGFDTLDGTISPLDGMYSFSITAGDLDSDYIVDAVTGLVVEGQLESYNYTDDLIVEDMVDPTDEVFVEDTNAATTPAEDESVDTVSEEV